MKYLFLCFFLISLYSAQAQIVKGTVSYYPRGPYQMTLEESWARVDVNGGLQYNRQGFLNFNKDNITFVVGNSNEKEEIYMRAGFENPARRMSSVIEEYKYMYYHFTMLDSKGNQLFIDYYPAKMFGTTQGIFVVSSIEDKYMYFLKTSVDEKELIKIFEKYR